jgi:OOP family OmpA-OmpF porin
LTRNVDKSIISGLMSMKAMPKKVEEDVIMTKLKYKLLPMAIAIAVMALIEPGPASAEECVRPRGPDILATTIVYFDFDSTKIPQDAEAKLKEIADRFKGHPSLAVCSLGQADRAGAADYNQKLALRRAAAVADVLKANGLQGAAYQIKSRGQSGSDNDLLEKLFGDNLNFKNDRRVEVMVMSK